LRRGELAKATAAARALEKKQPQNPLSHHMLGVVATAAKDTKAARKHFEDAVERSPTYLPSVAALASLDLADKRPDDARKRFQDVIARDPKNELAISAWPTSSRAPAPPRRTLATRCSARSRRIRRRCRRA
jgi:cellulose synthase operon protein C